MNKITNQDAKLFLFRALSEKVGILLQAVVEGKENFSVLKDSLLLEFLMLGDFKVMSELNNQLYKGLHAVLEK